MTIALNNGTRVNIRMLTSALYRGSNMSAHVLLINSIIQVHEKIVRFYHMTLKLLKNRIFSV